MIPGLTPEVLVFPLCHEDHTVPLVPPVWGDRSFLGLYLSMNNLLILLKSK